MAPRDWDAPAGAGSMTSVDSIQSWRIINASSARYVRLSIGGRPFAILGTDGGLIEASVTVGEMLLTPADRVDMAVGLAIRLRRLVVT